MAYRFWICGAAIMLGLGCNENQPKATRGVSRIRTDPAAPGESGAGFHAGRPAEPFDANSKEVRFGAIALTAPEGWTRKQPQSSFLAAEFSLPRAPGDDADGRLTLSLAGGSAEANIERWKGQFTSPLEQSKQEQIDCGGLQVTLVDMAGEYSDQRGPVAPAVKRAGYRLIGAIIPVGDQLHFVKAVGPQKTMEAHAEKVREFVRSVKQTE
jgi:hypothetical protein